MKSFFTLVSMYVTISLLAAPVSAAQLTVFSQPTLIPASGPHAAFSSRTQSLPDPLSAIAYDDFVLPAGSHDINGLSWAGEYSEPFPANPNPRGKSDFLIQIWSHDVNAPDVSGGPLHSFILNGGFSGVNDGDVVTALLPPAGHVSAADPPDVPGGGDAFHYEASLPVTTLAGETPYWLSIQALQTFPNADPIYDPTWMWHLGTNAPPAQDGFYAQDSTFDDIDSAGVLQFGKDLAFELKAVPEPSAGILLFAGALGLCLVRRRR